MAVRPDDITRAVLARDDVARYLRRRRGRVRKPTRASASRPTSTNCARRSGTASIARCSIRSIRFCAKSTASPSTSNTRATATRRGHVVYVSNHKSHLDYLIEPLVLDDHGIRPPLIAAGINLFGGALGLLHRHVTGAIPIRRNSKDPLYLVTLRAYVAEVLQAPRPALLRRRRPQLQRRAEVAEDRPAAGGAAGRSRRRCRSCRWRSRTTSCSRIASSRAQATQAARAAVRAGSRRNGAPRGRLPRARVRHVRPADSAGASTIPSRAAISCRSRIASSDDIGLLYKVLPTALVAAAMRPQMTRARTGQPHRRAARRCSPPRARIWRSRTGRQAVDEGVDAARSSAACSSPSGNGCACAIAIVLRYYARTIEHLLAPRRRTHALMLEALPKAAFSVLARQRDAQTPRVPLRHAAARQLRAPVRRRRDGRRSASTAAREIERARPHGHARPARRKRRRRRPQPRQRHACLPRDHRRRSTARGRRPQHLAQAHAARPRRRPRDVRSTTCAACSTSRTQSRLLRAHRHGELAVHRAARSRRSRRCGTSATATSASCIQSYLRRSTSDMRRA